MASNLDPDFDPAAPSSNDNEPIDTSVYNFLGTLSDEQLVQQRRSVCIDAAANIMVRSKLFESGAVSPDDLGPFVCEVADNLFKYITEGIVPPYMDKDDTNG